MKKITKEEQLAEYASLLKGRPFDRDLGRNEERDISGNCLNCGTEYVQFMGVTYFDPYHTSTLPIPCPTCFYNPSLNGDYIKTIVDYSIRIILSKDKVEIDSDKVVSDISNLILNAWPKNLEEIIKMQKEVKENGKKV